MIVAGVDLSAPDVRERLTAHRASPLLRGVRDYGREDYIADPAFQRGVAALDEFDLLLDLDCAWGDMAAARDLARSVPQTTVVLEHIGYPREPRNPDYFAAWRTGMTAIAEAPNVMCKISGVGMLRPGWTVEELRPWVEYSIDTFGPDRCMFGSNWPIDRLYASYDAYVDAFRTLISGYSVAEQALMLTGVAERVYAIPGARLA